jgi:hypothetical protein
MQILFMEVRDNRECMFDSGCEESVGMVHQNGIAEGN